MKRTIVKFGAAVLMMGMFVLMPSCKGEEATEEATEEVTEDAAAATTETEAAATEPIDTSGGKDVKTGGNPPQ